MRTTLAIFLAILPALSVRAAPAPDVTPQQVDDAINKATAFLYAHTNNGIWDSPAPLPGHDFTTADGGQWGGTTALTVYALLAAGENPHDPYLAPAIEFLKTANLTGTYALAMRLNVCEQLDDWKTLRPVIEHDAAALIHSMHTDPQASGLFYYDEKDAAYNGQSRYDHSNSQIAVLGLWAASECGLEIADKYWELIERAWLRNQDPSGGWTYQDPAKDHSPRASMTAAGVATLFITQDMLHGQEGVDCTGNRSNPAIDAGRKWMAAHVPDITTTGNYFYNWYAVERVGLAGGYKYVGDVDWFKTGAGSMVHSQGGDGAWGGFPPAAGPINIGSTADTSLALLFLAHGRAPIMLNKLEYALGANPGAKKPANWDQRPRDAHNLVHWAGRQSERLFNWQIVNLTAPVEELHDAPILYIAGDRHGLSFTPDEEAKLRTFVEQGGLIVGNTDCGINADSFTAAFKKLGARLFPAYEFRRLPKSHLIFHNQFDAVRWADPLPVDALGNGAREFMLLFPVSDPSRYWQTGAFGGHVGSFEVMLNIYLYATDKLHHYRGQTWILKTDPAITPARTIKVARLRYGGNWDPEPGGWRRLATFMHNQEKTDLVADAVDLGDGKLAGYAIAHMTGNTKFSLATAQQAELKQFLANGGTLILDACGGATDFSDSAQAELAAILGPGVLDQLKQPLPPTHPALSKGSVKCAAVGYRAAAQRILTSLHIPRIRGIEIAGRVAVFLSPEDLSVGLVGQQVDGIYGYQPQATASLAGASELMSSLLLYAAQKPAATQP